MKKWKKEFENGDFGAKKSITKLAPENQLIHWSGGLH